MIRAFGVTPVEIAQTERLLLAKLKAPGPPACLRRKLP